MIRVFMLPVVVLVVAGLAGCVTESSFGEGPPSSPKDAAQLNLELGIGYLRQNDWLAARDKLEKALEQDPSLADANTALALVYEQLGDSPAAERNYRRAVQLEPDSPDALNSLAAFLCRNNQRDAAMKYFDRALAVPLSVQFANRAMLNTNAGVCIKQQDLELAEAYLRAALAVDPSYSPALVQLADVTYERGNYLQSRAFLERYMSATPSSAAALWLGVRVENALGDAQAASTYATRLKKEFPEAKETGLLLEQERDAG